MGRLRREGLGEFWRKCFQLRFFLFSQKSWMGELISRHAGEISWAPPAALVGFADPRSSERQGPESTRNGRSMSGRQRPQRGVNGR